MLKASVNKPDNSRKRADLDSIQRSEVTIL